MIHVDPFMDAHAGSAGLIIQAVIAAPEPSILEGATFKETPTFPLTVPTE